MNKEWDNYINSKQTEKIEGNMMKRYAREKMRDISNYKFTMNNDHFFIYNDLNIYYFLLKDS